MIPLIKLGANETGRAGDEDGFSVWVDLLIILKNSEVNV